MISIETARKKFEKLAPEIVLTVDSNEVSAVVNRINKRYNIDINGLIIFIFTGDLNRSDIVEYLLVEQSLDKDQAEKADDDISKELIEPILKRLSFLDANYSKTSIDKGEIMHILLDIFGNSFVDESSKDPIIITAINLQVFYIFKEDLDFQEKLEKVLYDNEEVITQKEFVLNGKPTSPTIANWLKDFIKTYGAVMFDSMVLIKYMTGSENVKRLDVAEKAMVKRVLVTYRNLKFFPESMVSDNVEDWEIFPIDGDGREVSFTGKKTREELVIEDLKKGQKEFKKGTLENEVIEEEISHEREVEGLKLLLKKYKKGTLEYTALEEEIRKKESGL